MDNGECGFDMSGLRVRDLWDSSRSGPEGREHVRVRRHPWDGLVEGILSRHRL